MAHIRYTPEMVSIAEEVMVSQARLWASTTVASFETVARFAELMKVGVHAEHATARLLAYSTAAQAFEATFFKLDEDLGAARTAEIARDKERERVAHEKSLDRAEDDRLIVHAERLLRAASLRASLSGPQEFHMRCPVCDDEVFGDGVCPRDQAYAFDASDPNPPTTVRYQPPAPAKDRVNEIPASHVRIEKGGDS